MSESLFSRLLSLHQSPVPEEDFFTEIIGWLFENLNTLLHAWVNEFFDLDSQYVYEIVSTQVSFSKIADHQMDSRPDIVIKLYRNEDRYDVIMIESKLGSAEHDNQLQRYAEQLVSAFPDAQERFLAYFTRSYDPKDTPRNILGVHFRYFQWCEFYSFLKRQPMDIFINQVMQFMEEKGMSKITQISPSALASFNTFPDIYNFFQQTLFSGEVTTRFREVVGKPWSEGERWWNVANYRRYLILAGVGPKLSFFMGYRMPDTNDGYPSIQAFIEVAPAANRRIEIINVFKRIDADTQGQPIIWNGYNLNKPKEYAGVISSIPLTVVLSEQDHVTAIKKRFLDYLDEFERIKSVYPDLLDTES